MSFRDRYPTGTGTDTGRGRQFGNVLVLAGTYNSDLSSLIDGATLRRLIDRTIRFLRYSEAISPTLKHDAEILEHIQSRLFPDPPVPTAATSSFSSG